MRDGCSERNPGATPGAAPGRTSITTLPAVVSAFGAWSALSADAGHQ